MAKYAVLKSFYASEKWQRFRMIIIADRGLRCEHCREIVTRPRELTLHHIIELTPENVNDANISLNPENILVVHHECHNKIHNRFGHKGEKNVYIVFGPPMSGKTSYVQEHMGRGDLVVDMDKLYEAISFLPSYDKPDNLLMNVRVAHNHLIDNIKTRFGKWNNAWIIGGYPDKYKRDRLAEELGAEVIFCDVSKEECIRRLRIDEGRKYRIDEWEGYINKWFDRYVT